MNGIVKEEKSDETWEKEGDKKNGKESGSKKEPGKMFSSLFFSFSHFPLWAAEQPEQSLQLNHTDGISSKKFKKGRRKKKWAGPHDTTKKNPVFSLHITTMNFVS